MPLQLSPSEQQQIQQWATAHGTPQQVAMRCQIVLAAADGESDVAIAALVSQPEDGDFVAAALFRTATESALGDRVGTRAQTPV
jgi:hypothetical protein